MRTLTLALVAALARATPLVAQHGHHGPASMPAPAQTAPTQPPMSPGMAMQDSAGMAMMGPNMMAMMDSMMRVMPLAMRFAPGRLLQRAQELELSLDQTSRLTSLQRGADAIADSLTAAAAGHAGALRRVLEMAEPEPAVADAHLDAVQRTMAEGHRSALRAALEARNLLLPAQRARVLGSPTPAPSGTTPAGGHAHDAGHSPV